MIQVKKLCVYGIAALSIGAPMEAALAQCGTASWYHEGSRTANGERYRPDGISAAHRTLPFGTRVQVRNQRTGRSITVRINDRGPFIRGRIIDLSRGARQALGMGGLAPVCLAVVGRGERVASADRADSASAKRPRLARAKLTRQRSAKLRGRVIARANRAWTKETALRNAERRRARRVELREQRRMKRQAALERRMEQTGL